MIYDTSIMYAYEASIKLGLDVNLAPRIYYHFVKSNSVN